jgi:hypothetical protein
MPLTPIGKYWRAILMYPTKAAFPFSANTSGEKYANEYWEANYGLGKCTEANQGEVKENANEASQHYGHPSVCNNKIWEHKLTDDRDGKVYKWVKIGEQIWMAENLDYATFGYCYESSNTNCDKYGMSFWLAFAKQRGMGCIDNCSWR